ncbi:MAG TPA: hypothetical protein VGL27_08690 [Negativicutes bacterium]
MLIFIVLWGSACVMGGIVITFAAMIISRAVLGFGESLHWPDAKQVCKELAPHQGMR